MQDMWQAEARMIWDGLAEEKRVDIPAGTAVAIDVADLPDRDRTWDQLQLVTPSPPPNPVPFAPFGMRFENINVGYGGLPLPDHPPVQAPPFPFLNRAARRRQARKRR